MAVAENNQFFDIWITETSTGYRKVPFSVVTDWMQQGRLLAEDMVCVAGTNKFVPITSIPGFAPYLPKSERFRSEDKAEALEPVQLDIAKKPGRTEADEDVDMIPLIDVSLVLLIFFMMTASAVTTAASSINTPEAQFKGVAIGSEMLWIGIDRDAEGQPRFSMGKGDGPGEDFPSREQLLATFKERLGAGPEGAHVRVRAHRQLPYEVVRDTIVELEKYKMPRGKLANILAEVSEKQTR
jgi:biopolymer transport protein ExbD